ncbi:MAG: hypothetical protein ABI779_10495 [Acidobacteriota bacterium]
MKRFFGLFGLLLLLTVPASASWHPEVSPTSVRLAVGQTATLRASVWWSGLWVLPWTDFVFDTADHHVAVASGRMTSSFPIDVTITGIGPGTTVVTVNSIPPTHTVVEVVCGLEDPVRPAAANVVAPRAEPVTLEVVSSIAHRQTFTWYRGHQGDQSSPIAGSGPSLTFTPQAAREFVWVQATTPCSTSAAEFTVDVPLSRRRSVRF